ncbi:MAG: QacE family quaternary ammonium compound efflux SMR transporter [Sphingobacteriaceae bacterium]|nr:MAG: QacE family quaternary ammonium compound efflux SMR transporter [Sphingobacteriaceae bacterium]
MMKYLYLSLAIVSEVIATNALKASEQFTRFWPSVLVVVGYSSTFYFLSITLKYIPIGVANAIWAGTSIVLVALGGWLFFKQRLDFAAVAGMLLIISGVLVMSLLSKSTR